MINVNRASNIIRGTLDAGLLWPKVFLVVQKHDYLVNIFLKKDPDAITLLIQTSGLTQHISMVLINFHNTCKKGVISSNDIFKNDVFVKVLFNKMKWGK